jgi:regulator of protease activity HflC (stomatin/prohibitin superfamily)
VQREIVSQKIKFGIMERLKDFNILLDDVSITALTFGKAFTDAIEQKQIAQQQAERARYQVDQAKEMRKATVIKAKGEAQAAKEIGESLEHNSAYIDLRRLEVAM